MLSAAMASATFMLLLCFPAAQAQTGSEAAAMKAMTPAQKAKLAPRRPTRQVVGSPLPIVTEGYRPTLSLREHASGVADPVGTLPVRPALPSAAPTPLAPLPVPVTACTVGGCSGADGVRYNNGTAGVVVDPAGRTCHKVGNTVQCF